METLITPAIFLPKDDKKDISKINTEVKDEDLIEEDFKDKEKEKSLFETYTTQLKTPEIFKKTLMSILRIILHVYMTNLIQILLMMFAMAGINHNQVSFI